MTTPLIVGSLFSGIGGLDLGLERAGMQIKWQVEVDPYANQILACHWPDVPRYGDVRECGRHNLELVDVLCGGFPCQDISDAGTRAGITSGTRSGLWFEYLRIVGELRPSYILLENVAAILHRGMDTVCGGLAEIGYDAEWQYLLASAFGLPHKRPRVMLVAYPHGHERRDVFNSAAHYYYRQVLQHQEQRGGTRWSQFARHSAKRVGWAVEPAIRGSDDGLPPELVGPRLKALGNAVVPAMAEFVGRCIVAHAERRAP